MSKISNFFNDFQNSYYEMKPLEKIIYLLGGFVIFCLILFGLFLAYVLLEKIMPKSLSSICCLSLSLSVLLVPATIIYLMELERKKAEKVKTDADLKLIEKLKKATSLQKYSEKFESISDMLVGKDFALLKEHLKKSNVIDENDLKNERYDACLAFALGILFISTKFQKFFDRLDSLGGEKNQQKAIEAFCEYYGENMNSEISEETELVTSITNALTLKAANVEIDGKRKSIEIKEFEHYPTNFDFFLWYVKMRYDGDMTPESLMGLIEAQMKNLELEAFEKKLDVGKVRLHQRDIDEMNGHDFEDYLTKLLTAMGYSATRVSRSKDQGADLIISKNGERTVVQAKRWANTVGNSAVQEAIGAKSHYMCDHAWVVTNQRFSRDAEALARSNHVRLIDGEHLIKLNDRYL